MDSSSDDDSDDDRQKFVIGGSDDDSSSEEGGNFKDENDDRENPSEWQSINVNDEERGVSSETNPNGLANYSGSEEENKKRRMIIIGLAICCCIWLVAAIAFGVMAFTKEDDPPQTTTAVVASTPAPVATTPAPSNNGTAVAPDQVPITEAPSISPSTSPSGFFQTEFVYPAIASTFIQKGVTNPQINSPTLLVENGNGNSDASALIRLDVSSKIDNIFRQRRQLAGQFTGKSTKSFLRLFLAADAGSPPPKLTLFLLPEVDLQFLTAQEFNPVLAEELQSFRFTDLPHPAVTGIANMDQNVFLPPPKAGDPIWIDITDVVDSAAAFGEESVFLMLENRDAVQAPGSGTQFYGVNSEDPPALVVFLDDTVPTISPAPSMSMAPSMNPTGSIYPTGSDPPSLKDSTEPSSGPSTSYRPTNMPSKLSSTNPTIAPSSSARPSASERPSGVPSGSGAPSVSAQPSKVASGAPSKAPVASEFPTNTQCLPCPQGQALKFSTVSVASMSESCADLRLRLLYSEYAVFDATPVQCTDIVDTCGCEVPVACTPCTGFEKLKFSAVKLINDVKCQDAQITLATQPLAYGTAQCAGLKDSCGCGAPTTNCRVCPEGQVVGDRDYVLSTTALGLVSCGDLELGGSYGYIDDATCSKLETAGVADLCGCELASDRPSISPSSTTIGSVSIQPSFEPSKQPSLSSAPSDSLVPSKQPSASNAPSTSLSPSKQPSTSAAPSQTP
ncbi:unnamed protein product [Cylindrotheca closterium]|uniref:Circumsporozoite protein n=1 Tax=Cylindrotheca closterium TaxID=2856 RepID=A0AAD2CP13_9STRA|nr:unnamed protein product [Cylindrotheca closterium]